MIVLCPDQRSFSGIRVGVGRVDVMLQQELSQVPGTADLLEELTQAALMPVVSMAGSLLSGVEQPGFGQADVPAAAAGTDVEDRMALSFFTNDSPLLDAAGLVFKPDGLVDLFHGYAPSLFRLDVKAELGCSLQSSLAGRIVHIFTAGDVRQQEINEVFHSLNCGEEFIKSLILFGLMSVQASLGIIEHLAFTTAGLSAEMLAVDGQQLDVVDVGDVDVFVQTEVDALAQGVPAVEPDHFVFGHGFSRLLSLSIMSF